MDSIASFNEFSTLLAGHILKKSVLLQIFTSIVGFVCGYALYSLLHKTVRFHTNSTKRDQLLERIFAATCLPLVVTVILWTIVAACREFRCDFEVCQAFAQFSTAWLFVRSIALIKMQSSLRRILPIIVYSLTLLAVFNLLSQLTLIMGNLSLTIGEFHISMLSLLKGGSLFLILLWGTVHASRRVERSIKKTTDIDPSHQELFAKLVRIILVIFSVLISLSASGINLSAFALVGGAIGVGIGFGLQKVVSNFICGIILLLDRSIKPGDVITLEEGKSYGEITKLGARCATIRTRAGKEHLIPNEDFIIQKAVNWSLSDHMIRLSIPMRAGLDSDVELVLQLLLESAQGIDRITFKKEPSVRLRGFSDSAIEVELRVWIKDPKNGVSKVKSDIYVKIWKLFKQHGIKIPHAQSDLFLQGLGSPSEVLEALIPKSGSTYTKGES